MVLLRVNLLRLPKTRERLVKKLHNLCILKINEDDGGMNAFMRPCACVYGINMVYNLSPYEGFS